MCLRLVLLDALLLIHTTMKACYAGMQRSAISCCLRCMANARLMRGVDNSSWSSDVFVVSSLEDPHRSACHTHTVRRLCCRRRCRWARGSAWRMSQLPCCMVGLGGSGIPARPFLAPALHVHSTESALHRPSNAGDASSLERSERRCCFVVCAM